MRGRSRRIRTLAACAVIAVATGVAVVVSLIGGEQVCTMIGGTNGVSARVVDRVPGLERAVLCVEAECEDLDEPRPMPIDGPFPETVVLSPSEVGPGTEVDVVLVLDRRRGARKIRSTRVTLRRSEPNGPECGTWWNASVRFVDDRLVEAQ